MVPVIVNVKRTLITGGVLLALALAGSLASNAFLNGLHQSEVTANIPSALVVFSSFVLFTLQMLGSVLIAIAVVVRLSRSTRSDAVPPEATETHFQSTI